MARNAKGNAVNALTIGSVANTIEILEAIKELDGARNVDLVDYTGMSKGSVHKHLKTLHRAEFLTEEDGVYQLSFRFLDFGEFIREKVQGATYIQNALDKIIDKTNEIAYYMMEEHGRSVIVYRRQGSEGINTQSRSGKRLPMHQNAGGKAMLAHKPDSFVEDVIERHGLPKATEPTITNRERLYEELETIRERGYAMNREESSEGIHAVSAPVVTDDDAVGACSVIGPKRRLTGDYFEEELPNLLLTISNELTLNLKHS